MINRSDFNEDAFDAMFRNELIDQLANFEFSSNDDSIRDAKLIEAFKRVIAYNSVPGSYQDGQYD